MQGAWGRQSPTLPAPVRFWWIRLPLAAHRISAGLAETLLDGYYLVAWPLMTAIAPPLVLITGLLIGAWHPGFGEVFTQSMLVMVVAAAIGILSAQSGLLFVTGFALGDFFLWHGYWVCPPRTMWLAQLCGDPRWEQVVRSRVPLLIVYGVIALLAVGIPIATKGLLAQFPPPRFATPSVWFAIMMAGHAVLTGALVYLWAQAVPLLIRPVFTWRGDNPPEAAVSPLQDRVAPLVVAAVIASLARMTLQRATVVSPRSTARLNAWEANLAWAAAARPSPPLRPPAAVQVAATAAWSTLLLAGVLEGWAEAALLAGLLLVLQAARARLIPVPLGAWPQVAYRVPHLIRLVAGTAVTVLLARMVLPGGLGESFRPLLHLLMAGLIVAFLFSPGLPTRSESRRGRVG